jgi:hypothetical protein
VHLRETTFYYYFTKTLQEKHKDTPRKAQSHTKSFQ